MANFVEVLKDIGSKAAEADRLPVELYGPLLRDIRDMANDALAHVGERVPLSDDQVWGGELGSRAEG